LYDEYYKSAISQTDREVLNLKEYLTLYEYSEIMKRYSKDLHIPNLIQLTVYDDEDRIIVKWNKRNNIATNVKNYDSIQRKISASQNTDKIVGRLLMVFSPELINDLFIKGTALIILSGIIIALCVIVIVMKIIHKTIVPINNITDRMRNYDPDSKEALLTITDSRIYEFNILYSSFREMDNAIKKHQSIARENAGLAAIGQTTSMLAHDVRKPFSILKAILDSADHYLSNSNDLEEAKLSLEKSIKQVETMINDIMDFSREEKLDSSPTSIVPVFDFSIRQASQHFQDSDIDFIFNISNSYKPMIDDERISRVFVNIISNGIEAILQIGEVKSGTIDISTTDISQSGVKSIRIVIGNDGPPIDEENIPHLFDSFFTKGKKKGTGIGLASALKIVTLHGGTILAQNREGQKGVEFIITLPASNEDDDSDSSILPKNIVETQFIKTTKDETEIEKMIKMMSVAKQNMKILLLEDEALYRASVRNAIKQYHDLDNLLTLYEVQTVDDALKLLQTEDITHAIVDVDLGDVKNGFDFLAVARKSYPLLRCMVHSNRCIEEDKKRAYMLGAKAFVPKPLNVEHLVAFLQDEHIVSNRLQIGSKLTILLINDERALNLMAKNMLNEVLKMKHNYGNEIQFHMASSYNEAIALIKEINFDFIFCDLDLGSSQNGYDVLNTLKELKRKSRFYIISGTPRSQAEPRALELGADGYLQLPIDPSDFIDII